MSTFELVDRFEIKGRGTAVSGWVTGLVSAGDLMRCGDQVTRIRGVETHPVANVEAETRRRKVGLLVWGELADYHPNTKWEIERS